MKVFPKNSSGKWAVGLTIACVALLLIYFLLETLSFLFITAILAELAAIVLSIMAIRKEKAILTYCALAIGILAILFLLTHSLFIND